MRLFFFLTLFCLISSIGDWTFEGNGVNLFAYSPYFFRFDIKTHMPQNKLWYEYSDGEIRENVGVNLQRYVTIGDHPLNFFPNLFTWSIGAGPFSSNRNARFALSSPPPQPSAVSNAPAQLVFEEPADCRNIDYQRLAYVRYGVSPFRLDACFHAPGFNGYMRCSCGKDHQLYCENFIDEWCQSQLGVVKTRDCETAHPWAYVCGGDLPLPAVNGMNLHIGTNWYLEDGAQIPDYENNHCYHVRILNNNLRVYRCGSSLCDEECVDTDVVAQLSNFEEQTVHSFFPSSWPNQASFVYVHGIGRPRLYEDDLAIQFPSPQSADLYVPQFYGLRFPGECVFDTRFDCSRDNLVIMTKYAEYGCRGDVVEYFDRGIDRFGRIYHCETKYDRYRDVEVAVGIGAAVLVCVVCTAVVGLCLVFVASGQSILKKRQQMADMMEDSDDEDYERLEDANLQYEERENDYGYQVVGGRLIDDDIEEASRRQEGEGEGEGEEEGEEEGEGEGEEYDGEEGEWEGEGEWYEGEDGEWYQEEAGEEEEGEDEYYDDSASGVHSSQVGSAALEGEWGGLLDDDNQPSGGGGGELRADGFQRMDEEEDQ